MFPERIQRLDDLGFAWDHLAEQWEEGFDALSAYKEQHGHCRIPVNHKFNGFNLGMWINNLRKQGQLSPERKQRLEELGFVWSIRKQSN